MRSTVRLFVCATIWCFPVVCFADDASGALTQSPVGEARSAPQADVPTPPALSPLAPSAVAPAPTPQAENAASEQDVAASATSTPEPPPPEASAASEATERRLSLLYELNATEAELTRLRAERSQYPIGGPIAMMGIGYGGALLCGLVAIASFSYAESIEYGLRDDDEAFDDFRPRDVDRARRVSRIVGGLSALPLALGIAGSVMLAQRVGERRKFRPELRNLVSRRRLLERELRYGIYVDGQQASLTVSRAF